MLFSFMPFRLCRLIYNAVMRPAAGVGDYQPFFLHQQPAQLAELPVGNPQMAQDAVLVQLPLSQPPDNVQQIVGRSFHKQIPLNQ